MGWFRRAPIAVALWATAVSVTSAGVLAAGNPGREPLPAPPDVVGSFCGDPVGDIVAHVAVQRQYIKTFTSNNGVVRYGIEGYQLDTFTVVATGKRVSVNASGPATITDYPDGTETFVLMGHTVYVNPPGGGIFLYTGKLVFDTTTGQIISFSGGVKDICALLTK
jgi:hypothetical protein